MPRLRVRTGDRDDPGTDCGDAAVEGERTLAEGCGGHGQGHRVSEQFGGCDGDPTRIARGPHHDRGV